MKFPRPKTENDKIAEVLKQISDQLERLIVCQEKRLSGEVIKDFNSKEHLTKGGK